MEQLENNAIVHLDDKLGDYSCKYVITFDIYLYCMCYLYLILILMLMNLFIWLRLSRDLLFRLEYIHT